jgi:hypothetical protein
VVKWELQIDSRNRGLVGVAGEQEGLQILQEAEAVEEEVHQRRAWAAEVGRSIEAEAVVAEHLIEAKEVEEVHLIEAKEGEEGHLIEVRVEVEKKGRLEEEVQDVRRRAVVEERVNLVPKAFSEVMEVEESHLLVGRNEYGIVVFLLMEVGEELRPGLELEVVQCFSGP